MRLIHTSDWHLGRTLHGESLLEHQSVFLDWLVGQATARHVDVVVVAGDVYDRAVPPTDAVALLDQTLVRFFRAGIPVVLTSGNHDSAVRLGFASGLSEAAGIHLRTRVEDIARPVIVRDGRGEGGVYGLPDLPPDGVVAARTPRCWPPRARGSAPIPWPAGCGAPLSSRTHWSPGAGCRSPSATSGWVASAMRRPAFWLDARIWPSAICTASSGSMPAARRPRGTRGRRSPSPSPSATTASRSRWPRSPVMGPW